MTETIDEVVVSREDSIVAPPEDSLVIELDKPSSVNALFEGTYWDNVHSSYWKAVCIRVPQGVDRIVCQTSGAVLRYADTADFKRSGGGVLGVNPGMTLVQTGKKSFVHNLSAFPGVVFGVNESGDTIVQFCDDEGLPQQYLECTRALCLEDGRVFVHENFLIGAGPKPARRTSTEKYLRTKIRCQDGSERNVGLVKAITSADYLRGHLQALTYAVGSYIFDAVKRRDLSDMYHTACSRIDDETL